MNIKTYWQKINEQFLKISYYDTLLLFTLIFISHTFFVLKERLFACSFCLFLAIIFSFFKKIPYRNYAFLILIFFCSFWLILIPYPIIGRLFWPIDLFAGTILLVLFNKYTLKEKSRFTWKLQLNKQTMLSLFLILIPSVFSLYLYFIFHKNVANKWPLPNMPIWAIPFAVAIIALINGLREEIYFRFFLQNYLKEVTNAPIAIIGTSIVFGYLHFQAGFPEGYLGVILTSLFGLMIGIQFNYFKSATLSWITHSITDAIMFVIILLNKS